VEQQLIVPDRPPHGIVDRIRRTMVPAGWHALGALTTNRALALLLDSRRCAYSAESSKVTSPNSAEP
jgi:hypothetical protein